MEGLVTTGWGESLLEPGSPYSVVLPEGDTLSFRVPYPPIQESELYALEEETLP